MNVTKTIPRKDAEEDLTKILLSMGDEDNQLQELVFPAHMIEDYCTQRHHTFYRFAHDLSGQPYMRARIDGITLEFLVRKTSEKNDCLQSHICQIHAFGKMIYHRPNNPVGTIHII